MLKINRLRLQLPASFQGQAGEIARLIGQELREIPMHPAMHLDRLAIPPLETPAAASSREVARAVARAIGAGLRNPRSRA